MVSTTGSVGVRNHVTNYKVSWSATHRSSNLCLAQLHFGATGVLSSHHGRSTHVGSLAKHWPTALLRNSRLHGQESVVNVRKKQFSWQDSVDLIESIIPFETPVLSSGTVLKRYISVVLCSSTGMSGTNPACTTIASNCGAEIVNGSSWSQSISSLIYDKFEE